MQTEVKARGRKNLTDLLQTKGSQAKNTSNLNRKNKIKMQTNLNRLD